MGGSPAQGVRKNQNAADENFRQQHPFSEILCFVYYVSLFWCRPRILRKRGLY